MGRDDRKPAAGASLVLTSSPGHVVEEIAKLLLGQPAAIATLLREHVADRLGHCRACPVGGQQGHLTWPCTIHAAAMLAAEMMEAADGGPL